MSTATIPVLQPATVGTATALPDFGRVPTVVDPAAGLAAQPVGQGPQ